MKWEFWIENKHHLWHLLALTCFSVFSGGIFLLKNSKRLGVFVICGFVATVVVMFVAHYLAERLRQIVCVCGGICRYSGMDMDILMYSCEKCGYSISEYGKNYNWHSCPSYHPRPRR